MLDASLLPLPVPISNEIAKAAVWCFAALWNGGLSNPNFHDRLYPKPNKVYISAFSN